MRWIVRRIVRAVLTIYLVITITFMLLRLMPGNAISYYLYYYTEVLNYPLPLAKTLVQDILAVNPDASLWDQYAEFIINLLQGNMGKSFVWLFPVSSIIAMALPWTVFTLSISLVISFSLGVTLGMLLAYRRESTVDNVANIFASITNAVPDYVWGILIILILAVELRLFPSAGNYSTDPGFTLEFMMDVLHHATLPIITYVFSSLGAWMLGMRGSTISVLGEDYVAAAEARGLHKRRITFSYVGRNAILPLFTSLILAIGGIFGGSVLIENLFTYQGIGWYLSMSVHGRDYPMVQGCFLIITTAVVVGNLIADILYSKLDPRIKLAD